MYEYKISPPGYSTQHSVVLTPTCSILAPPPNHTLVKIFDLPEGTQLQDLSLVK